MNKLLILTPDVSGAGYRVRCIDLIIFKASP